MDSILGCALSCNLIKQNVSLLKDTTADKIRIDDHRTQILTHVLFPVLQVALQPHTVPTAPDNMISP